MAENAVAPVAKKPFIEAFFAEAERKDPNKKTVWEVIVGPAVIVGALFTIVMLGIAVVAFSSFVANGHFGAANAASVTGTVVQDLLT